MVGASTRPSPFRPEPAMRRPFRAARAALAPALAPALAAALLLAPVAALAQAHVVPGARVRLAGPGIDGTFHVVHVVPDTMVVQRDPAAPALRVALADLQRMDVSLGRRTALGGFGHGVLVGAGVGAAIGVASGLASGDDDPGGWFAMSAEQKALGGGILAGGAGGLIGGIVGLAVRGERWERAAIPGARVSVAPAGRGVAVRIAGAF